MAPHRDDQRLSVRSSPAPRWNDGGWQLKTYYVYLLASRRHGTLYLGVTNDLARRVSEHKSKAIPGFSARYDITRLVWYEAYERIDDAIAREKSLKKWRRDWKIRLIEEMNPDWSDLARTN